MFSAFMTSIGTRLVLAGILYSVAIAFWPPSSADNLFDNTLIKYTGLVLIYSGTIFIVIGKPSRILLSSWLLFFLLVLAFWMATGSILYLNNGVVKLEDSFLGRSLVLSMSLLGGICATDPWVRMKISSGTASILGPASLIAVLILLLHSLGITFQGYRQIYHEESVLIVAGLSYFCNKRRSLIFSAAILILILFLGFFTGKSTTVLLGLVFFAINFGGAIVSKINELNRRGNITRQAAKALIGFMLVPAYFFLLCLTWFVVIERVNRYDRDLRIKMWNFRWNQFLESPIHGDFFVGTPLYYEPLLAGRAIPTHNDYLDLLAHGGVVAFALYFLPVLFACFGGYGMRLLRTKRDVYIPEVIFWIIALCYIVSSLGNPVFSEAYIGVITCFSVGFICQAAKAPTNTHVRLPVVNFRGRRVRIG